MARTVAEIDADIAECRAEISSARKAASYSINGRAIYRQKLSDLRADLNALLCEKRAAEGKSRVSYPRFASK